MTGDPKDSKASAKDCTRDSLKLLKENSLDPLTKQMAGLAISVIPSNGVGGSNPIQDLRQYLANIGDTTKLEVVNQENFTTIEAQCNLPRASKGAQQVTTR